MDLVQSLAMSLLTDLTTMVMMTSCHYGYNAAKVMIHSVPNNIQDSSMISMVIKYKHGPLSPLRSLREDSSALLTSIQLMITWVLR